MVKKTFNFIDKLVLTYLSLLCKSGLLYTVLLLFSSSVCSAGMLCINSCSHFILLFFSAFALFVILLFFCSFYHFALILNLLLCILSSTFLTVSFFFTCRTTNPTQSISSSFLHSNMTVHLPNSLGKNTTTV
jgi:hypothetical protein